MLAVAKDYVARYPKKNPIQIAHADALVKNRLFRDAMAYLEGVTILPSEHRDNGSGIWQEALCGLASDALDAGRRDEARCFLEKALSYPENLGVGRPYDLTPVIATWPERLRQVIMASKEVEK